MNTLDTPPDMYVSALAVLLLGAIEVIEHSQLHMGENDFNNNQKIMANRIFNKEYWLRPFEGKLSELKDNIEGLIRSCFLAKSFENYKISELDWMNNPQNIGTTPQKCKEFLETAKGLLNDCRVILEGNKPREKESVNE